MRGRAHGSRKNGFLLTGLRAISSALSRHRSRRLRVRISVGFSTKRHEFRRFDAVRSWLPIDRRRCQTNYLLPPPTPLPALPSPIPSPPHALDIGKHFTNCYTVTSFFSNNQIGLARKFFHNRKIWKYKYVIYVTYT